MVGAFVLSCFPGAAWAESDVDILLNKLVEKGVLSGVEAGQIRREISDGKEAHSKQIAKDLVPDSSRNWRWSGDLRLREEYRNRTGSGTDTNRQRIRFRYGFEAKVTDALKVGARLATGSTTDAVSTNQTLNTAFNHKPILLDRAFVAYTPEISGLTDTRLAGGILETPFWWVGPLVWDEDLNFDGLTMHVAKDLTPMATVFTNDGLFVLQSDVNETANLWSAQGGVTIKPFPTELENELEKNLKLTAAVAYHDYQNVTNPFSENGAFAQAGGSSSTAAATPTTAQLKGNSAGVADFNLLNPNFEIASQYADIPFSLFGDWVHNTGVSESGNGFMIGVKAGKARIPFDLRKGWEAGYYFERLEPDATFGPFTDSDFGNGGGTNHRGHVYWVKLATLKNSVLQLKYSNTRQVVGTKANADTFQTDWVTKF